MGLLRRNHPVILAGRHISITNLAEELGMDKSYVSRILRTRDPRTLTVEQAAKIAAALEFETVGELIAAIDARQAALDL